MKVRKSNSKQQLIFLATSKRVKMDDANRKEAQINENMITKELVHRVVQKLSSKSTQVSTSDIRRELEMELDWPIHSTDVFKEKIKSFVDTFSSSSSSSSFHPETVTTKNAALIKKKLNEIDEFIVKRAVEQLKKEKKTSSSSSSSTAIDEDVSVFFSFIKH